MADRFKPLSMSAGHLSGVLVLVLAAAVGPVAAASAAPDASVKGRSLAQQVYDRPEGADMATRGSMILTEANREPRVRQMYTFRRDSGDGNVATLIRFTSPADIADTGLLTLDHADGTSDQWVFLPALGNSRRIPSARRGGRFVGSDLFFEDIQERAVDLDQHLWLRSETVQGVPTEVLESTPVDPDTSTYGRRVSWIHMESLIPLRIDFYRPRSEQPFKRLTVHRIEDIDGYWTVMDSVMEDLDSGHQTQLRNERTLYDQGLPEQLFTLRALVDPALEQPHRP